MRDASLIDTLCGTLVQTARVTLATWSVAFNLLDPWAPLRAYVRVSRSLLSTTRIS